MTENKAKHIDIKNMSKEQKSKIESFLFFYNIGKNRYNEFIKQGFTPEQTLFLCKGK